MLTLFSSSHLAQSFLCFLLPLCLFRLSLSAPAPAPLPEASSTAYTSSIHNIYQYPNKGTWIENLAVRYNGQIIISRLDVPDLYQVNPFTPGQEPTFITTFPGFASALGITELAPDIFAVVAGNFSLTTFVITPPFAIWKLDMRSFHGPGTAKIEKVTDIPEAKLLNGATTLDAVEGTVLVADSLLGAVFSVNIYTGAYKIVQDDATMKGPATGRLPIGINGVRIRDGNLYFTNSGQNIFVKVPINADGTAAGAYKIIVENAVGQFDDFALDIFLDTFAVQGRGNTIAKITSQGVETEVAGNLNSTAIAGPTSARFGRTPLDLAVLYMTTNGGLAGPVDGTIVVGGQVVAVNVPIL